MCAISYWLQHGTDIYLFQTPIDRGDKYGQNKLLFCRDAIHQNWGLQNQKSNSTEGIKDFH